MITDKQITKQLAERYKEIEKQERKVKQTESIKSLEEQFKVKEQECNHYKQMLREIQQDLEQVI